MAVSTTNNRISYTGNGVTTAFSFPYKFLLAADLVVVKRLISTGAETVQTLTTHYTVTGAGAANGGTVTMLAAPSSLYELVIYNDPDLTQEVDLVENDANPAEVKEGAFDKLTIIAQRLRDVDTRSVRLSDGFAPTFDPTLPVDLDAAANKVPLVNADGDGWADAADWPTADEINDAAAEAAAAAASAAAAAASAVTASGFADDASDSADAAAASAVAADASADAAAATLAAAIAKITIDAAGDLLVGTGDDTIDRLAVGTDNQVLTVDTSLPKKMKWSASTIGQGSQGFGTTITSTGKTLSAADDGKIFKLDSSAGTIAITAHAAAAGFKVTFIDIGGVLSTNAATLVRDGSQKIQNISGNYAMEADYGMWTWYFDGTDWWMGE